jgi:transcriptional regulator of heat shock response
MKEATNSLYEIINNKKINLAKYENTGEAKTHYVNLETGLINKLNYISELIEAEEKKNDKLIKKLKAGVIDLNEKNDKLELICIMFGVSDYQTFLDYFTFDELLKQVKALNKIRRHCNTPIDLRNNTIRLSKRTSEFINKQNVKKDEKQSK